MTAGARHYLIVTASYWGFTLVDGALRISTMRFHDEVVEPDDLDLPQQAKKVTDKEAKMADALVASLRTEFDPEEYELREGGWDHEHCDGWNRQLEVGQNFWQTARGSCYWLCPYCYRRLRQLQNA